MVIILTIVLVFSSTAAASDYAARLLSPLKQVKRGILSENVVCKQGLQLINKKEDGSPACVAQTSFTRLLSVNCGFDPSKEWVFDGLSDMYRSGEPITFTVKVQGFGSLCLWPHVYVKQDNKTVWTSKSVILSCPLVSKAQRYYYQAEWKTGLDSGHIGNLILNQTGTYSIAIDSIHNGKSLQKNITIVP